MTPVRLPPLRCGDRARHPRHSPMARGGRGRRLTVCVSDERGRPLSRGLGVWLARVAPMSARGVVNIAVVSDLRVRALNRQYRGRDYATDVLSFTADPPTWKVRWGARGVVAAGKALIGDIVIARGVARRQARRAGHAEGTELRLLALHGLLHLLGYDHERDRGTMARLERRLCRKGGLSLGLIERP